MADDIDKATEQQETELNRAIAAARGYVLPSGSMGDCDLCGEHSSRLVKGVCAPCRDKYGLE